MEKGQPNNFKRKRLYKLLEVSTLKPISSNNLNCKLYKNQFIKKLKGNMVQTDNNGSLLDQENHRLGKQTH